MHEASLAQGLLQMVLQALNDYNQANPEKPAKKITEIKCGAGLLAGFENQTLVDCFELFTENTAAEGARLSIMTLPLNCHCLECDNDFLLTKRHFVCPQCGGEMLDFRGGTGLELQAVNVEDEESND